MIIVLSTIGNHDPCLGKRAKEFSNQAFMSKRHIEPFVTVDLLDLSWLNPCSQGTLCFLSQEGFM
jgi:hypothetical protein